MLPTDDPARATLLRAAAIVSVKPNVGSGNRHLTLMEQGAEIDTPVFDSIRLAPEAMQPA